MEETKLSLKESVIYIWYATLHQPCYLYLHNTATSQFVLECKIWWSCM